MSLFTILILSLETSPSRPLTTFRSLSPSVLPPQQFLSLFHPFPLDLPSPSCRYNLGTELGNFTFSFDHILRYETNFTSPHLRNNLSILSLAPPYHSSCLLSCLFLSYGPTAAHVTKSPPEYKMSLKVTAPSPHHHFKLR
ncbi:hypothetical protein BDD12DRAFT_911307 [Trichophaea hybrida]|nr:hypothetical protein BDD12DRAFT_911307 [Trichophaea hybrida]